jgi:peptidyl-prolyl cis-trans isomerase C
MQNKRRRCVVSTTVLLFLALTVWPVCAGETGAPKDKVAGVNGVIITRADFDREMNRAKQVYGMGRAIDPSQLPEMKKKVLENLIEREVLFQESQKKGIKIDESVVSQELEKLRKRFPSEEEFKENLGRMDLTEAALKSEFRRVMAVQQLIEEEIVVKVDISDKEIEKYYNSNPNQFKQPEQVKASHILIGVDSGADKTKKFYRPCQRVFLLSK